MLLCCSPLRNPSWTGCRGMEGPANTTPPPYSRRWAALPAPLSGYVHCLSCPNDEGSRVPARLPKHLPPLPLRPRSRPLPLPPHPPMTVACPPT